jgi:hypothetical protein
MLEHNHGKVQNATLLNTWNMPSKLQSLLDWGQGLAGGYQTSSSSLQNQSTLREHAQTIQFVTGVSLCLAIAQWAE